jgi:hypothetical protein
MMLRVGARGVRTQGGLLSSRHVATTARFAGPSARAGLGGGRCYSSASSVEGGKLTQEELDNQNKHANLLRLVNAYRTYGHFDAALDPLGRRQRGSVPTPPLLSCAVGPQLLCALARYDVAVRLLQTLTQLVSVCVRVLAQCARGCAGRGALWTGQ